MDTRKYILRKKLIKTIKFIVIKTLYLKSIEAGSCLTKPENSYQYKWTSQLLGVYEQENSWKL